MKTMFDVQTAQTAAQQTAAALSLPWQQALGAIIGLGIAAFGLVDASKSFYGGIIHIGFGQIRQTVTALTPESSAVKNILPRRNILTSLEANWANGTDLASQKAIAKSLVKAHLSPESASTVAAMTNVDPDVLSVVVAKIAAGGVLNMLESDTYSRFDFTLTALLDAAYENADRVYRNGTRTLAAAVAVLLAVAGGYAITGSNKFWYTNDLYLAILLGLLAAPIAPIAKDISTAVGTAIKSKIGSAL
jgi:hypothetical protein